MSRVYSGRFCVLMVWNDDDGAEVFGNTSPGTYEQCELTTLMIALGVPYEGKRVIRALIVPTVAEEAERVQ